MNTQQAIDKFAANDYTPGRKVAAKVIGRQLARKGDLALVLTIAPTFGKGTQLLRVLKYEGTGCTQHIL